MDQNIHTKSAEECCDKTLLHPMLLKNQRNIIQCCAGLKNLS